MKLFAFLFLEAQHDVLQLTRDCDKRCAAGEQNRTFKCKPMSKGMLQLDKPAQRGRITPQAVI
jgi:hypothetical protein